MSPFFTFTKTNLRKHTPRKKRKLRPVVKVGKVTYSVILLVAVFVTGLFYLVQINTVATKGFEIQELEKSVKELKLANRQLEVQAVELQSIQAIKDGSEGLDLTSQGEVRYLQEKSRDVARR
mgnify:CR=1 FL=1